MVEYKVISIMRDINNRGITETLNYWASKKWRVNSVSTNSEGDHLIFLEKDSLPQVYQEGWEAKVSESP